MNFGPIFIASQATPFDATVIGGVILAFSAFATGILYWSSKDRKAALDRMDRVSERHEESMESRDRKFIGQIKECEKQRREDTDKVVSSLSNVERALFSLSNEISAKQGVPSEITIKKETIGKDDNNT